MSILNLHSIDIFCEIIDNFGDIGVVYRLAKELRLKYPTINIRVILNRLNEFKYLNPLVNDEPCQTINNITYMLTEYLDKNICTITPADVIIESFGCNISEIYMEKAKNISSLLINIEYLSGEQWIEDVHLMESYFGYSKLRKFFFMPGFTKKSGGIIINTNISIKKNNFYKYLDDLKKNNYFIGTLFSYEKNFLPLLKALEKNGKKNMLFILGEKTKNSFNYLFENFAVKKIDFSTFQYKNIVMKYLDFLTQEEYSVLMNLVDYNMVRGEDSFVQALLTGKPFLWHIYLQDNMVHMDKLNGFIQNYEKTIFNKEFKNSLNIHTKLLRDYNLRDTNSYKLGSEDFLDFFENFEDIKKITELYANYLKNNCNLIDKLNRFILKLLGGSI